MTVSALVLLVTAVLLPLAVNECRDWCPWLAKRLVRWAARRLGDQQARMRYEEEWTANIDAVPGKLSPLVSALGYLIALPKMRWTLRRARPALNAIPAQLPRDLSFPLVGREHEIAALDMVLLAHLKAKPKKTVAVIAGIAGVGKTSLAVHWAHRNKKHFPGGILYIHFRNNSPDALPVKPVEALGQFLLALGADPANIPADLEQRVSLYRDLVARRRILIVLDDAATAEQVRPLLPGTDSPVLVTSRWHSADKVGRSLTEAHLIPIDTLSDAEAIALLRTVTAGRRHDNTNELTELARLCLHLPLTLCIAAESAARHPQMPLRQLIRDLRNTSAPQGAVASTTDQINAIRTVFSWSYRELPPGAARLFRRIGALPTPHFSQRQAARLAEANLAETDRLLNILVTAGLTRIQPEPDTYQTHELLFTYARELLDEDEDELTRVHTLLHPRLNEPGP